MATGDKSTIELSGSNVLYYNLVGGTSVIVCPSGTEPMSNTRDGSYMEPSLMFYISRCTIRPVASYPIEFGLGKALLVPQCLTYPPPLWFQSGQLLEDRG